MRRSSAIKKVAFAKRVCFGDEFYDALLRKCEFFADFETAENDWRGRIFQKEFRGGQVVIDVELGAERFYAARQAELSRHYGKYFDFFGGKLRPRKRGDVVGV